MKPVLLLDVFSLFLRAHFALPHMNTQAGEPTSAIYGFCALLLKLLKEHRPEGLVFAFDSPGGTVRHGEYAAYKAGRAPVLEGLEPQLVRLHQLIAAFEAEPNQLQGYEADDVLATCARVLEESGRPALIVSGDRDLLQLVRGDVRVLFVGARARAPTLYDESAVLTRFGFESRWLPTYAALVGDPSDNLPKVPGIGPRTASRLISRYGDAAAILAHLGELPERQAHLLKEHAEQVRTTERLARLHDNLPVGCETARLSSGTFDSLDVLFQQLEFESLRRRLPAVRAALRL